MDKAKDQGDLSILHGSDIGYDVFGSGMYTSERMIKEHPDTVKAFTAAYLEAFQYVIDHPEEAAAITAASSDLTKDKAAVFMAQLKADLDFTFTDATTKAHGLGFMDPAKWIKTKDVLAAQKLLKADVSVWTLYDNTFQAAAMAGK
jgi:NitT/TauT family transport system substrate-binding protein